MNVDSKKLILTMLPKWIAFLVLTGLLVWNKLDGQTYTVGDTINNFGTSICANDGGFEDSYWEYNVDGRHKITWINLFTTW